MGITGQRSNEETHRRARDWACGLYPETESETAKAYGDRADLARALPTLTQATPEKHAQVAARMMADMEGGA